MDSARKKELKNAYKSKPVTGGICCIRCSGNQRLLIKATEDIESLRNRFNFAMVTKTCPDPSMRDEWAKYGGKSFSFEVLEEIRKGEDQTEKEFSDDINDLYTMWLEKCQECDLR